MSKISTRLDREKKLMKLLFIHVCISNRENILITIIAYLGWHQTGRKLLPMGSLETNPLSAEVLQSDFAGEDLIPDLTEQELQAHPKEPVVHKFPQL